MTKVYCRAMLSILMRSILCRSIDRMV